MPSGDTLSSSLWSRWWPPRLFSWNRTPIRHTPTTFIPLRPFIFVARRTLILCVIILISYVLVTNMIGYEKLWSNPVVSYSAGSNGVGMVSTVGVEAVAATTASSNVDHHLLHRQQQRLNKLAADHDEVENDVGLVGGRANDDERTNGNETNDGPPPRELTNEKDLIVDQPHSPELHENDNNQPKKTKSIDVQQSLSSRERILNRSDDELATKTGDVVDEETNEKVIDGGGGGGGNEKNGAQLIETILLNKTTKSAELMADEQRHQKLIENNQRRNGGSNLSASTIKLPICPMPPPDLIGPMKQAVLLMSMLKESDVIRSHPELLRGGHWKPENCKARYKIAVIVPFRDRQSHLNRLIDFLIPMLERQLLDFRFIVTEQYGKDLFNKGRIMNAAFMLAEKLGVDCVIFHDVDMFPQDDRNYYYCPDEPKHLGAFVNTLGYELWYDYIVGGVLAIGIEHYRQINGYSNMYWAWGGEDDDMGYRILANNLTIERPQKPYGTYTMLKHVKRQRTAPSLIYKLLNTAKTRWPTDGLNQVDWKVVKLIVKPLYYHLYVDVGVPPDEWRYEKPTKKK